MEYWRQDQIIKFKYVAEFSLVQIEEINLS